MSGISSGRSSKRNLVDQEEDISSPSWVADPMSMDWTDEKHRLFLSSMEATFVKQLYKHKTRPVGLLHWNARIKDLSGSESSRKFNGNNHVCDSQKINVERARPQLDIVHESHVLLENQWIRHFRSAGDPRANLQENVVHSSEAIHSGGGKTAPFGVSNSPNKLPTCHCREDSLDDHAGIFLMELGMSHPNPFPFHEVEAFTLTVPCFELLKSIDPHVVQWNQPFIHPLTGGGGCINVEEGQG
ncbi:hypothetical protein BVC80_1313g65 [Macleaya cordata]|uniref:Uncharacterized protein n=1 Tax=Macleaya cordata TaxID=56857 RepID=A0A200QYX3_MACCD|nr:hypothetical protein BVC80_1313g65 [Macleaya cordata]